LKDGVDGELGDEAQEDVEAIYSSGKHLLHLINEILDMAKIEAGQMNLMVKDVDLVSLIQEVARDQQILVKDKNVQMLAVEATPIPMVEGDRVRLKQVLLNLLSNAIKFTERGSITIRYGMQDAQTIRVDVEDTGPGMAQEHLDIIFERFRQVDGSTTRRAGGTGLGLAITRQLVEMHGGEIFVASTVDVGSTFSFTLPVKPGAELVSMQDGEHRNGKVR
jgi:signal transduction histidine kinase